MMDQKFTGQWDFEGACAPSEEGTQSAKGWGSMKTFTLGCFQWVPRGKDGLGKGLKKGKVQYRIRGHVSNPKEAYEKARAFCENKNKESEQ